MRRSPTVGPRSPLEQRSYQQGYTAGKRLIDNRLGEAEAAAIAAGLLFEDLVDGLVAQGLTLDDILDAQIVGAKARLSKAAA